MSKRIIIVFLLLITLAACGKTQPTWQEQYDLGVRYLSEGNYEEAIIAFTAAIEIDPKQAQAYVGRGDAYVLAAQTASGGTDQMEEDAVEAYHNAIEDYLAAIELGETDAGLYQKAADVYTALGDLDAAAALLGEDRIFLENVVSAGDNSIAVVKADGSLWAWGAIYGFMGSSSVSAPTEIMTDAASVFSWNASTDGHSGVPSVYTAVLKTDGTLWLLGDKPYPFYEGDSSTPVQVMDQVASASAGENSLAVLKTDGSLWIYGWEGTDRVMDDVIAVSSCGVSVAAIKADGSLWMWGGNFYGQLGTGGTEYQAVPVKVMDGVSSVSVCHTHTAAIKMDGSLWMWGDNSYGQLGTGMAHNDFSFTSGYTYDDSSGESSEITVQFSVQTLPVKVMDQVALVSVNGGGGHSTHAVRKDGSLWCWGSNSRGQLGNGGGGTKEVSVPHVHNDGGVSYGTYVIQDVPVQVMDNVAAVSGNSGITVAAKRDGTIWMAGQSIISWEENIKVFTEISELKLNLADAGN